MTRPYIPNVLADRYTSTAMLTIWEATNKIKFERQLWILVMRAQLEAGTTELTAEIIQAYEDAIDDIDLERIREIETKIKHDVLARIQQFNEAASKRYGKELQFVHIGMTSRDLTENVEQLQIRLSMELIYSKLIAVMARLYNHSGAHAGLPIVGRSHNVAAQMTMLSKRFSNTLEEFERARKRFVATKDTYPLRGIKGSVGTQQDILDILQNPERVAALEQTVLSEFGFAHGFVSVGQVYPRSLDLEVLSTLNQIAAVGSNFGTTLRLMAGNGLVTEGFSKTQGGSSAMPHKMNARTTERICGAYRILCGFVVMIQGIAGDQWNDGDVSCSIVRRVALPDSFFTIDGFLEAWLHVLDDFGVFETAIQREINFYLPLVSTTKLMMAAVKQGTGREDAHEIVREHGTAVARGEKSDLLGSLADDERWPFDEVSEMSSIIGQPSDLTGTAETQIATVMDMVQPLLDTNPEAVAYKPEKIL